MAKSVAYNPKSDEITSPPIASMSEAISYITDALNMKTVSETDIPLTEVYIEENDRFRIFQAPEGKRVWVASPVPVVKKNGTVVSGYHIVGGGIVFDSNQADGDSYTVDCTYIINNAENKITPEQLSKLSSKSITAPVTLTMADWVEDTENGWWTQSVSNPAIVDGRKVDISASPAVVKQISEAGAMLVLENNAGTATIYSLGAVPTVDITIAIRISEVNTQ